MDPRMRRLDLVAGLLDGAQMPEPEVARRLALARDADYWRRLVPGLSLDAPEIADPFAASRPTATDEAETDRAIAQFRDDGYFQALPLLADQDVEALNRAIDGVAADGWPSVFAWMFDAYWRCARLPRLARILDAQLGAGYRQIQHIWTHVVPAVEGSGGWPPHFDGFAGGRASVWIALTDATLENGCIHVVPPRLLPAAFRTAKVDGSLSTADVVQALRSVRALPARAGTALGWGFDVYHWGGTCVRSSSARRAISLEFVAASQTPAQDETPLISLTGPLPDFATRLRLISRAILAYEKFEPGLVRLRPIAEALRGGD